MPVKIQYLTNVVGRVIDLNLPYKAIIIIDPYDDRAGGQRALLWSNKLTVDGKTDLTNECISNYLKIHSKLIFTCHLLDATGPDNCAWFIAAARRQDAGDMPIGRNFSFGIVHGQGYISETTPRRGVLNSKLPNGEPIQVLFQASKLFLKGTRYNTKLSLSDSTYSGSFAFDAVPVNPLENDYHISWFATVVWKGQKPICSYDEESSVQDYGSVTASARVQTCTPLADMCRIVYNPRALFWRGYGIIGKLFDEEYGLLLGRRKPNRHESILFHRNFVTIFRVRMYNKDLKTFLKEGFRVQFVAVPAPRKFMVQWIASHVSVDEDGHLHDEVNMLT